MPMLLSSLLLASLAWGQDAPEVPENEAPSAPDGEAPPAPVDEPPAPIDEAPAPSAGHLCANAAAGTEVDVCLTLAAEYPDQLDTIAAALRSHVDRSSVSDRDLLSALLLLLDDASGVHGAASLGALADPRAVPPLVHAAEHRELPVAVASVGALATYPESLEHLTSWLIDKSMPLEVRVATAYAIGELGAPTGADALVTALRRKGVPSPLRQAMLDTIREDFPERLAELGHQVSEDGTIWLAAGGAVTLGYALSMAGYYGQVDMAALGAVTGATAGATGGWVAGRAWPMEASDAAFLTTSGIMGTTGGTILGAGIGRSFNTRQFQPSDPTANGAWIGGLTGQALGYSLGFALRKAHPGKVIDAWEATFVSGATALAAGTSARYASCLGPNGCNWDSPSSSQPELLATGAGLLGGMAIGHVIAPSIDITRQDRDLMLLSTTYGLTFGLMIPVPDDRQGLPFTGMAVGALSGYALSGIAEAPSDVTFGGGAGMIYGGVFGGGIGLLADPNLNSNGRTMQSTALAGTTLGLAAGAWAAHRNEEPINANDVVLTSMVTGFATWQSLGWYTYAFPPPSTDGWFMIAPAVIGGATALASPVLDVPVSYSFSAASMGLWGAYLGGVVGELSDVGSEQRLLYTLIGSDAGLGLGIFMAAPPLSMPPLVIGLADAGGVLGGSTFAVGASFFTRDVDTILTSSLFGSAGGFAAGALLGRSLYRSGASRDVAFFVPLPRKLNLPGRWTVMPTAFAGQESVQYGGVVQVTEW